MTKKLLLVLCLVSKLGFAQLVGGGIGGGGGSSSGPPGAANYRLDTNTTSLSWVVAAATHLNNHAALIVECYTSAGAAMPLVASAPASGQFSYTVNAGTFAVTITFGASNNGGWCTINGSGQGIQGVAGPPGEAGSAGAAGPPGTNGTNTFIGGPGIDAVTVGSTTTASVNPDYTLTTAGNNIPTGNWDASNANQTIPDRIETTDPGTCVLGETYYNSSTQKQRRCISTNTWADSGGSSANVVLFSGGSTTQYTTAAEPAAGVAPSFGGTVPANTLVNVGDSVVLSIWLQDGSGDGTHNGTKNIRLYIGGSLAGVTNADANAADTATWYMFRLTKLSDANILITAETQRSGGAFGSAFAHTVVSWTSSSATTIEVRPWMSAIGDDYFMVRAYKAIKE